ncbi:hypothetical protein AJ79_03893 [Helicocarpus griseus UAMH5409]|uniref:BZIP domain-containing protein n=1 Tax=Helicocarpus griseus UAMH5409 TaxID=1447875 RepID=A0A2B7XV25_9EURO|nr:hypothetical protein AJ79_03893 [Helicocarpus griseus UAMH5409]
MTTDPNSTRIRDNQRRSRARRKEYLQDLEKRVRKFEQQGVHATIEVQAAARKVARENELLRSLLRLRGATTGEIEGYLAHAHAGEGRNGDEGMKYDGNGCLNTDMARNNNDNKCGTGCAQLSPSATCSSSTPTPTPTSTPAAAIFQSTTSQNENHKHNQSNPPIYSPYYPAESTSIPSACAPAPPRPIEPTGYDIPTSPTTPYTPSSLANVSASLSPPSNSNSSEYVNAIHPSQVPRLPHQQLNPPFPSQHNQLTPRPPPDHPSYSNPSSNPNPTHAPNQPQTQPSQPQPVPTPSPPISTSDTSLDATSCEVAASIIAGMRGDCDPESVRAELGCAPGGAPCRVGNLALFQVMDKVD